MILVDVGDNSWQITWIFSIQNEHGQVQLLHDELTNSVDMSDVIKISMSTHEQSVTVSLTNSNIELEFSASITNLSRVKSAIVIIDMEKVDGITKM